MPSISNYVRSLASSSSWYVRTLVSEVRNVPRRIRILPRKKNDPLDLGPLYEESPTGELVPCKATIARTQYVEFLLARYPWASDGDVLLALDGWDKGTEYISRTSDTSNAVEERARREQYPLALIEQ
jgi:hypothetical protein